MKTNNYIFDEQRCRDAQRKYARDFRDAYGQINGRPYIGSCVYLYKKYGEPTTYEAFYDAYTHDFIGDDKRYRGRSHDELMQLSRKFQQLSYNANDDVMNYYDYLVKKIIIDTFDGVARENAMHDALRRLGYGIEESSENEDCLRGIDCFATDKYGERVFAVQMKPAAFFIGGRTNRYLIQDRVNAFMKTCACNERYNIDMYYVVYDNESGRLLTSNDTNNIFFDINDLLFNDGTSRMNERILSNKKFFTI